MIDLDNLDEYDLEELSMCCCSSCTAALAALGSAHPHIGEGSAEPVPTPLPPMGGGEGLGDITNRGLAENVAGAAIFEVLRRIITRGF